MKKEKTVLIIDGQGGRLGSKLIEELRGGGFAGEIVAVGANAIATAAMIKAGATRGATGENPVIVTSGRADIIAGPIGIVLADAMDGEITEKMACAVARSDAEKILIPMNRCGCMIAGIERPSMSELVKAGAKMIADAYSEL